MENIIALPKGSKGLLGNQAKEERSNFAVCGATDKTTHTFNLFDRIGYQTLNLSNINSEVLIICLFIIKPH